MIHGNPRNKLATHPPPPSSPLRQNCDDDDDDDANDDQMADDVYDNCDISAGCFGDSDGCVQSRSCELLVTYELRGDGRYRLQLYGRQESPGYLALGLSTDTVMVSTTLTSAGRMRKLYDGV